jgi:hypothetical protein
VAGGVVAAVVVVVVGAAGAAVVVGVAAPGDLAVVVVAPPAAAALPVWDDDLPAGVVVAAEAPAGFGMGLNVGPALNNPKLFSCPGPAAATPVVVVPAVVDPGAPGVVVADVVAGACAELDPPLTILRIFGPWSTATPRKTTPRTIAAMRARRSRS